MIYRRLFKIVIYAFYGGIKESEGWAKNAQKYWECFDRGES